MEYPTKNNNDKKFDGIGGKKVADVDTTLIHERLMDANQIRREFAVNDDRESFHHTDQSLNRNQALRLLNKLKQKEVFASKVFWKDGQPTLVESTSEMQWDGRMAKMGFTRPETKGLPATDSVPRMPSSWEAKLERKRRRTFTLDETPTMAFKASGHLPAHYYMDESALEAYVASLTNEK